MSQPSSLVRLLNFSHPYTPDQVHQVEAIVGCDIAVVDIVVHLDPAVDFSAQLIRLILDNGCQTDDLLELPGLAVAAALVVAIFSGLHGHMPVIVRRARTGGIPVSFQVVELIDLDAVRNRDARGQRPS